MKLTNISEVNRVLADIYRRLPGSDFLERMRLTAYQAQEAVEISDKNLKAIASLKLRVGNAEAEVQAVAAVVNDEESGIASLNLRAGQLEDEVTTLYAQSVLKAEVTDGKITKLAVVQLDAALPGESSILLSADRIDIDGLVSALAVENVSLFGNFASYAGAYGDTTINNVNINSGLIQLYRTTMGGGSPIGLELSTQYIRGVQFGTETWNIGVDGNIVGSNGLMVSNSPVASRAWVTSNHYTKTEINALLAGKADADHEHLAADIPSLVGGSLEYKNHAGVNSVANIWYQP